MSEWISVEDRLPESNKIVLVVDSTFAKTDAHDLERGYGASRSLGVRFGYVSHLSEEFRV